MRRRARAAGTRRRALIGVATVLALLAVSLAALAVRQVGSESRAYLEDRGRRLRQHVELARSHLERLEGSALDDLARAFADDSGDPRAVERSHPLIDRAFRIVEGHVRWPSPVERARYGEDLGTEEVGTPLASRLLDRAYRLLADGEQERALEAFEHSLGRKLLPSTRAEALLQMATILAADPLRGDEAVACFDRVLELEAEPSAPPETLLPWKLAARYRKVEALLDGLEPSAGIRELIGFAEEITAGQLASRTGEFAAFYQDRALEHLSRVARERRLSSDEKRRCAQLEATLHEARADAAFRREVEELWLPALGARGSGDPSPAQRIFRETGSGPRLLVFRGKPGSAAGVTGMRVDLDFYGDRLLERLRELDGSSSEGPAPRVLGPRGEVLFGGDQLLDEAGTTWLEAGLGGDVPWTIAVPVSGELRAFQLRRGLLYGGLVAVAVLVITIAALATLRGMHRAVELADLKSEFVANVSHELKTPLTLIRMFTDLLVLGYTKDPEGTRENLKLIARETETLSLLIDNILDLSRIEAGEKEYHPAPADLRDLVRRGVDDHRPYLERGAFSVEVELPAEFPSVEVDAAAFARALSNLLSNCVKYSGDRKEVGIRLRLENGRALVEVVDRGVGLRPEDADRVFERFFQVRRSDAASSQQRRAGTGIGLAIVKHIVEAHGGAVRAAPREGGGSRFTMSFPVTGPGPGEGKGTHD